MKKKLTIKIDEQVYQGLYRVVGPGKISQFIEKLVRPHVVDQDLNAAYEEMAQDYTREQEAFEWTEYLMGDLSNNDMFAVERANET